MAEELVIGLGAVCFGWAFGFPLFVEETPQRGALCLGIIANPSIGD
jgi:hypothetical protein